MSNQDDRPEEIPTLTVALLWHAIISGSGIRIINYDYKPIWNFTMEAK